MPKYRKKPVVIEAFQWKEKGDFIEWFNLPKWIVDKYNDGTLIFLNDGVSIKTLEGEMKADINDYIIKGIQGELYPCKPDIFDQTYEEVIE